MKLKSTKEINDRYNTLKEVRDHLESINPYHNCTKYQQGILSDIEELTDKENYLIIKNIINRTESEFIRLEQDIKKNAKSNKLSMMIGILGVLVSVFMTLLTL